MNEREHVRAAFRFLEIADGMETARDALAKSEMLWCAAAHIAKAIAVQEKWDNRRHDELFDVAGKIIRHIGYPDAFGDFSSADRLHKNMYQGNLSFEEIGEAEIKVRRFVNRVGGAVNNDLE